MIKFLIFFLLLTNVYAKDNPFEKIDSEGAIRLEADEITYLREKKQIILKGNVIIQKQDLEMFSDYVDVFYKDTATTKTEITLIKAKDNITIKNDTFTAKGDLCTYNLVKMTIRLENNVKLFEKDAIITGDVLNYNTETKNINMNSNKKDSNKKDSNKKVKIVIDDIKKMQEKYE